jgi:hypothetical protein
MAKIGNSFLTTGFLEKIPTLSEIMSTPLLNEISTKNNQEVPGEKASRNRKRGKTAPTYKEIDSASDEECVPPPSKKRGTKNTASILPFMHKKEEKPQESTTENLGAETR